MSVVELIEEYEGLTLEERATFLELVKKRHKQPAKEESTLKNPDGTWNGDALLAAIDQIAASPEAKAFSKAWGNDTDKILREMRDQW